MSIGYPDYARLSQQGGAQLYDTSGSSPAEFTFLFKGYIGAWPYITLLTNLQATSDFVKCVMAYYTDSTFTTEIAESHAVRGNLNFGHTQYANLSPWLGFWYVSQSGLAVPFNQLALYASTAPGDVRHLYPLDEGLLVGTESIGASSTSTHNIANCCPGRGIFQLQTTSTTWFVNVYYYSYNQAAYVLYKQFNSTKYTTDIQEEMPLPDAPLQVQVHNSGTASATFVYGFMAVP